MTMFIIRHIKLLLSALVLLPLLATAVLAAEARATAWVNVRSGPGTSYAVIDTMAPGEVANITECQGSWCYVERDGPDGWVSSSYLTAAEESDDPDCSFQLVIGPDGPRFAVTCGDGSGSSVTINPTDPNRVCFYKGANFTGAKFCRTAGTYNTMPAGFNDTVTSIRTYGSARVRVCEFANMGPYCRVVSSSESHLGAYLDNAISSFRIANGPLPPMKQACLFDLPNYGGDHVCFKVGTHTLPVAAQNRASSVLLLEGALARLSKSPVYGIGGAYVVTTNKPVLPAAWNNKARSIRVE